MRRLAVLWIAAVLASCGETGAGDDRATLRVDAVGDAATIVADETEEGLTAFDAGGQVVPGLATSWRISDDGLSVIFRLRTAAWTDGRALTASDAVAVMRRAVGPGGTNPLRPLLAGLANAAAVTARTKPPTALGVEAPVDNVVEIRLDGAMPELLQLLAQPGLAIVRTGAAVAIGPFQPRATPPGDAAATRSITLTRNPAYHSAADVALGTIVLTPTADPATAIARFARDRTDIVVGRGLAGFGDARLMSGSDALRVETGWSVYGYIANVRRGPLADLRVRRALAMAIDRDDLGSRLFGVALTPVLGLAPALPSTPAPAMPDWASQPPEARLATARQLLAEAGFTADAPLAVTISLPDAREHAAVAAEVAADWARLGVRTVTVARTAPRHALAVARGNYELALVERRAPADTSLFFLAPFACAARSGGSSGGYCNPQADDLLDAARTTADPVQRSATLARAETAMLEDTPMISLFAPVSWALVARRVTGWTANPAGQHPLARLGIARGQEVRPAP